MKNWVYESDWTQYENAREYTLYPSLQNYLFDNPTKIVNDLKKVKKSYYVPF